jgi:hypothetical protein
MLARTGLSGSAEQRRAAQKHKTAQNQAKKGHYCPVNFTAK